MTHFRESFSDAVDVVELAKEPSVDFRELMNMLNVHAKLKSLRDCPHSHWRWPLQFCSDLRFVARHAPMLRFYFKPARVETRATLVNHPQCLLDCLLERTADRHDLA